MSFLGTYEDNKSIVAKIEKPREGAESAVFAGKNQSGETMSQKRTKLRTAPGSDGPRREKD